MLCNAIFLTDIGQSIIAKFLAIIRQKDFWCTMLENGIFMNCIGYSGVSLSGMAVAMGQLVS